MITPNRIKKILFIITVLFIFPLVAEAAIKVNPIIIDLKAKPRDILKEIITIENSGDVKETVYVFVNNILSDTGKQSFTNPANADLSTSLANWIEISRGVISLSPREQKTIPLNINVNLRAPAGIYHAMIAFSLGSNRDAAASNLSKAAAVNVNLEVLDDKKEILQLNHFSADKTFFYDFPVTFSYSLENIGNQSLIPNGQLRIYNRRGQEIEAVELNQELLRLNPDEKHAWYLSWSPGKGFGRYKAVLFIKYGTVQPFILQDTVFFWIIPWFKILLAFGTLAGLLIIIVIELHKRI